MCLEAQGVADLIYSQDSPSLIGVRYTEVNLVTTVQHVKRHFSL